MQRSTKFAKYLPQFGWRPYVWAVDRMDDLPQDPTLLDDLPDDVVIHRFGDGLGVHTMRRAVHGMAATSGLGGRLAKAVEWRIDHWRTHHPLPDEYAAWAKAGIRPALELIQRERITAIYSTYSPPSNHLLALAIKRKVGLPWIADFRDLWTDDYQYRETNPRRRAAHRKLEQEILERADVVIGVTKPQTEILAAHVPAIPHKFVTITNGFDPDDFKNVGKTRRSDDCFTMTYVGQFDQWRTSDALFAGLRRFSQMLMHERNLFRLRIVGKIGEDRRQQTRNTGIRCEFTDVVPHRQAVREMVAGDALLLNVPCGLNADSVSCAKTFEYLASGRPILAVGPPGNIGEAIVRQCKAGLGAGFDASEIAEGLNTLYRARQEGKPIPGCHPSQAASYSRRTLTGRLARLLDGLIDTADQPLTHTMKVCTP